MPWVRSGYCCRCGECCRGNPFPNGGGSELMSRAAPVQGYCPLFEWRNTADGPGFCAGHTGAVAEGKEDSYYLAGCNVWPDDPNQIANYPSCTYTFAWQD